MPLQANTVTFVDVTDEAGIQFQHASATRTSLLPEDMGSGAGLADIDDDGDLDLYIVNIPGPFTQNASTPTPKTNVLYRNNGNGTFTDITAEAGVAAPGGRSMQAIFSAFDNDNDPDLYVANDTSVNYTYRNEGNGTFTDVSDESWAADFRGSMGLTAGDYDGDGDIDLFISHWVDEENAMYRNLLNEKAHANQHIRFVDESYSSMLAEVSIKQIGWGTSLFDYDNDGDLDIFVANGSTFQELDRPEVLIPQRDQLFRNDADGTFTDVSQSTGIARLPARVSRGTAFGDYDNDGDVDIFIVNNYAKPTLLRNDATVSPNRNNWLHVKLVGTNANRDAIGAKIRVETAHATQIREIYAGESYMSSNSFIAEFGLGTSTQVQSLEVTWPNGEKQTLQHIPINESLHITQK